VKELAKAKLTSLQRAELLEHRSYIDGLWKGGSAIVAVADPATLEIIAHVDAFPSSIVECMTAAAAKGFETWRATLPHARGSILRRWAALLRDNADDLAVIASAEQGKPVAESRGEVAYAAAFLDWFAAEGERVYGETLPSHLRGSRLSVTWQPIGVTAAVTPWNFPIAMIARKAGAALAAGCSMIVKPAPETPLSALAIAKLADEAGVPAGVFQVVNGDAADLTRKLMDDPDVRAFSFTGSTDIGRLLLRQASTTIKKVSMELGGHAPFIVFDDADIELAVKGCMDAKFATSGQDCLAANRIYVHRPIYAEFIERFAEKVHALKIGHGLDPATDIGPMTRASVAAKCRDHVGQAVHAGARIVAGGGSSSLGAQFVVPTVLVDVNDTMDIAKEETFGPIAAILPFDSDDEVLKRANATEYGLAAYVYTTRLNRAMRMSERLEYGMVAVNTPKFTGAPIPFGGWKQSGLGREGSRHGILDFMEQKYVCFGNLDE
jgi:aspartate-semialdehyde dehydrogenase